MICPVRDAFGTIGDLRFAIGDWCLVERSLIIIANLFVFFLYPALKLFTVAMAMLKNFALPKEKIHNKFYEILIRERSTSRPFGVNTVYHFIVNLT